MEEPETAVDQVDVVEAAAELKADDDDEEDDVDEDEGSAKSKAAAEADDVVVPHCPYRD